MPVWGMGSGYLMWFWWLINCWEINAVTRICPIHHLGISESAVFLLWFVGTVVDIQGVVSVTL